MTEPLHLLSIGAGAIGTYVGGSLALQGHRVVFVERPDVAERIRAAGLRLDISGEKKHLPEPQVAGSMEQALEGREYDAALFGLKSFDTPVFLSSLTVPSKSLPPIVCLSNGVDNEETIAAALGPDKVIAGTVTSAIGRGEAGEIVLEKLRGVGVAGDLPLCRRLVEEMGAAGLNARLFARPSDMKWSKMLTNLLSNATSAILDMTPAEIFSHPGLHRLEIGQLREALRVMAARRIRAVDLPGVPVGWLARAVKYLPPALSRPILHRKVGRGRGNKMPSFHIDLHAGRGKSEVDYLNGAVVRAGRQTGVPTPVNRLLTDTLTALTAGEIPLDRYRRQPEKLIAELG